MQHTQLATAMSRVGEVDFLNSAENDINQQLNCIHCLKYKSELEELTQEILSAKKIIQLLQEDRNTYKEPTTIRMSDEKEITHVSNNSSSNWKLVMDKSRKIKRLNRNTHDQFPIPVIPITNRYNSLYNLQNDTEFLSDIPNYHTEGHNIKKNPTLNQRKARRTPTRKQRKILLIGDSHMRGCASELGKYLGPEYRVSGTFMPGARLQNITKLAMNEIAGFSKEDTVIIWGGSNDVNRNESMKGLVKLNEFVEQKNNTNIMIVNIPH